MRGLSSIIVGLLLFGIGCWLYVESGFGTTMLMFAVGGAVLFVRGCYGIDINSPDDVVAPLEFISNPADAIVDSAVDKFSDLIADRRKPTEEASSTFDPDAVIAKYLENRPAATAATAPAPPPRGFGRKALQG